LAEWQAPATRLFPRASHPNEQKRSSGTPVRPRLVYFAPMALDCGLFPDAEGGEDEAEDVVGGGGSGEGVEGAEGGVEVEEDQLVGQAGGVGGVGGVECGEGCRDRLLLAEVV